jgi:hypothetical protein
VGLICGVFKRYVVISARISIPLGPTLQKECQSFA